MIEVEAPASNVTGRVSVVFSANGAEEDYEGPLNYTYHDEPVLSAVVPAGSPITGGTQLTLSGLGFQQHSDVFVLSMLRCVFDWSATATEGGVIPQVVPVTFRNDTHVVCVSPPSYVSRPPYIAHGVNTSVAVRIIALRLSLNGISPSIASLNFSYYLHPSISALLPASGPVGGGTIVLVQGSGLTAFTSPHGRGSCRFGSTLVPMLVLNDSA
eukprot:5995817-Prymnesium_polylepis.1